MTVTYPVLPKTYAPGRSAYVRTQHSVDCFREETCMPVWRVSLLHLDAISGSAPPSARSLLSTTCNQIHMAR
jgi:hypothetical protein